MAHRNNKDPAAVEERELAQRAKSLAEFLAKHGDEIVFQALVEAFTRSGDLTVGRMLKLPRDLSAKVGGAVLEKTMNSVAPRDALERMLVEQLVFCHQRVQELAVLAARHGRIENKIAMDEQCNRAMTAYRRGMLALKKYRSQPVAAATLTISQSEQQDVLLVARIRNSKNGSNELGANRNGFATSDRR